MESTRAKSAVPGIAMSHPSKNMRPFASEIMSPQLGSGGCTPSPRKESAASRRMACAISTVATTIRWLAMFGRISVKTMRPVEQPSAWAAATKSRFRTCMVALRITTANRSQMRRPSTQITTVREEPTRLTTAIATRTTGMESLVVMRKFATMSTRPPKNPASTPTTVPRIPEISIAENPMTREMRAPQMRRER